MIPLIPDVSRTITSDLKRPGNTLVLVGKTKLELGGSVYWKNRGELGACVPRVDAEYGKAVLDGVYRAIQARAVVACHDLSEGGLGAAVAEMAIGGRTGVDLDLAKVVVDGVSLPEEILFSESQSRLLLEVPPERMDDLAANLMGVDFAEIGTVTAGEALRITNGGAAIATIPIPDLVHAFNIRSISTTR